MNIKIPEYLLKMPTYLPNDIEGMIFTYPNKFPLIKEKYEEAAKKYAMDPVGFRQYGDSQKAELIVGLDNLKKEYDSRKDKDLEYMVKMDQRLNKLFCFRFWIVNYLFADGPIHSFYVDNLRLLIRKAAKADETEKYELKKALKGCTYGDVNDKKYVKELIFDLLSKEYGVTEVNISKAIPLKELRNIKEIQEELEKVTILIDEDPMKNVEQINSIWKNIWKVIENNEIIGQKLRHAIYQVKFRSSMLPLYNILTHTIEFRKENLQLQEKYDNMHNKIDNILNQAKKELSADEYDLLKMSYEQAKNFAMYKDVMGAVDGKLIPFWFGIHDEIREILRKSNSSMPIRSVGQAGMFYYLVWYLPTDLKAIVMTPDFTDFSLEDL